MKTHNAIALAVLSCVAGATLVQGLHAQGKARAYVIAETEVTDPAFFKNYAEGTAAILPQAGGRFSVNGGRTFVINGNTPKRIAVIEWDSFEQAEAFYKSDAYKKLAIDRDKGSNFRAFVVEGLPGK
jgi:uncharacterized protein (DUF1330 family)